MTRIAQLLPTLALLAATAAGAHDASTTPREIIATNFGTGFAIAAQGNLALEQIRADLRAELRTAQPPQPEPAPAATDRSLTIAGAQ